MRVKMAAVVLAVLMFPTEHAQAEWHFKVLDYPAATDTQVFGINNHGTVVGSGFFFGEQVYWSAAFTYDSRKQVFTPLPPPPLFDESDLAGIADSGVMVGSVYKLSNEPPEPTQYGFTLSKDGKYRLFSHPGSIYFTGPRAINEKGLVTGWCDNSDPNTGTNGFIYDPRKGTFLDIVPSWQTIAQGINSRGDVVGSAYLPEGTACADTSACPEGSYGWLRSKKGAITYFRVNGSDTSARGLSESGHITGFVADAGSSAGFVTTLAGLPYESLTIAPEHLLKMPGMGVFPQAMTYDGRTIVGIVVDMNSTMHGFIATRKEKKEK
jgi:uncharacterized membrane protein